MKNPSRARILNPLERFSEILFGLIMVLSFTCALSVAEAGKDDVRTMFFAAIGCNLAWGIIDAAFYLIGCVTENSRNAALLSEVQRDDAGRTARQIIGEVIPPLVAEALDDPGFERIRLNLKRAPAPSTGAALSADNWRGSLGVFLLVFLSTLPVVLPFLFVRNARLALHISNGIAISLLFATGYMLAKYAGTRRLLTGSVMVVIGAVLVALTIALGG